MEKVKILGSDQGLTTEVPILETDLLESFPHSQRIHFPNGKLIPWLGVPKWDGHIFVTGPTGSGKTTLISEIVVNDKRKRKAFLFSDVAEKDPSFDLIWKSGQLKRVVASPKAKHEVGIDKVPNKGIIAIFDDTNNENFIDLRDKLLERGRHHDIMVICVSHKMRDRNFTKRPKNESSWIVTYPFSNKTEISRFFQEMSFNRKQRAALMQMSDQDGRYLILHNFAPFFMITEKTFMHGI